VFQQWENGKNVVEEWCFSNGKMRKMLLKSGVSAMERKENKRG
jgi:hypothetical protein